MPKSNIEAALKRATGRTAGEDTSALTYEANVGSVGLMIDVLTDKKTRTIANVKSMVKKG